MKQLIVMSAFVLFFGFATSAQDVTEFGSPDELKGVTRIYISLVYHGSVELKDRDRIVKEIEKGKKKNKITNLAIVTKPEDAEVILVYSENVESQASGAVTNKIGSHRLQPLTEERNGLAKALS